MTAIKIIILLMCLMSGYLSPLSYPLFLQEDNSQIIVDEVNESNETVEDIGYNITGLLTTDFEGYCTIDIPQSHWSIASSDLNTSVQKYFKYKDNKSRLLLGYVTNLESTTDIPGYIVQKAAQVDMTTNNREEKEYSSGTWMVIKSNDLIDGNNIEVWYKVSKDNKSAFWFKVSKDPEINEEEFTEVIDAMINTFNIYYISGGTLFNTPDTGIYVDSYEDSKSDEADYKTNTKDNTVFQSRGGFIADANISNNWKDMEVIIDGSKFKLPCTINDFINAGFTIRSGTTTLDTIVFINNKLDLEVINDKGTVVKLGAYNTSVSETKKLSECDISTLDINIDNFITASDDGKVEHELILAGGATWDVYSDDLKAIYGSCETSDYSKDIINMMYKHDNLRMLIRIGRLNTIKSVYMSVVGD